MGRQGQQPPRPLVPPQRKHRKAGGPTSATRRSATRRIARDRPDARLLHEIARRRNFATVHNLMDVRSGVILEHAYTLLGDGRRRRRWRMVRSVTHGVWVWLPADKLRPVNSSGLLDLSSHWFHPGRIGPLPIGNARHLTSIET